MPAGSPSPPWRLVREHAPYAVAGLVALAVRLHTLDRWPLSPAEAASAWAAAGVAQGEASRLAFLHPPPASAALVGLQSVLFWLLGADDVVARLGPALAGAGSVAAAWLLRRPLGRDASIALALLLAVDPLAVGYARLADGAALVSSACWFVVAGLVALAAAPGAPVRAAWLDGIAVAAGAALASGPLVWDLGPPLVASALVLGRATPVRFGRRHAVLAGAAWLAAATSGLVQWEGPPLVSASMSAWLHLWTGPASRSARDVWGSVLRAETLPVALAVGGLIAARPRRLTPLVAAWLAWGCLLTMRPGRTAAAWFVIAPPVLLGAAVAAGRLAASLRAPEAATAGLPRALAAAAAVLVASFVHEAFAIAAGRIDAGARVASTLPAVRLLAADVALIQDRAPGDTRLPVEVVAPTGVEPVLAWYLRHEPTRWVAAASPASPGAPRLIVEPAVGPSRPEADGTGYVLRRNGAARERVRLR
ncbi:MAG: hypothetical protein AB7O28_20890 [Vicinamibacterales bacterium]